MASTHARSLECNGTLCPVHRALCDERAGDVSSMRCLVFTPSGNWFPRPKAVHCEPITTVSLASDVSRGGRRWKQRKVMKRRDSAWRNRFRPLGMDLSSLGHDLNVNARSSQSAMNGAQLSLWSSLMTWPPAETCTLPKPFLLRKTLERFVLGVRPILRVPVLPLRDDVLLRIGRSYIDSVP